MFYPKACLYFINRHSCKSRTTLYANVYRQICISHDFIIRLLAISAILLRSLTPGTSHPTKADGEVCRRVLHVTNWYLILICALVCQFPLLSLFVHISFISNRKLKYPNSRESMCHNKLPSRFSDSLSSHFSRSFSLSISLYLF